MERGGKSQTITVSRTLPIDGALIGDVLRRLRRDADDASLRWTLGERGSVDVDVDFITEPGLREAWSSRARIWDPSCVALVNARVEISVVAPDAAQLAITPTAELSPWWQERLPAFLDLVHAVVDELAEELLYHAAHAGVATSPR
jgi:hypothetical protein